MKFTAIVSLIFVITMGCTGTYGNIRKQTNTDGKVTLAQLRNKWDDYHIYYGMRSVRYADAIMFDPKDNSTKLSGDSWIKIEDKSDLDKKIKDIQTLYNYGRVELIEGKDNQVFGYMYYPASFFITVKIVDESTLYIMTLPHYKSAP